MPRPQASRGADAPEPKKRSRNGCWPCKSRKVKCGEEKPQCTNCVKQGEACDYSIRLQWGGRSKKDQDAFAAISSPISFVSSPGWPTSAPSTPMSRSTKSGTPMAMKNTVPLAGSSTGSTTRPLKSTAQSSMIDPQLMGPGPSTRHSGVASVWDSGDATGFHHQADSQYYSRHPQGAQAVSSPTFGASHSGKFPMANSSSHRAQDQYPATAQSLPHPLSSSEFAWSEQHRAKRQKRSPSSAYNTLPVVYSKPGLANGAVESDPYHESASSETATFTPRSTYSSGNTPNTLGSSLTPKEGPAQVVTRSKDTSIQTPGVRRLSVNSLLSGPPGGNSSQTCEDARPAAYPRTDDDGSTIYGYDYGYPDLDLSRNNDAIAIIPQSPVDGTWDTTSTAKSSAVNMAAAPSRALLREAAFQRGGYYAQPVPIKISKEFEPLPSYLSDSPMNLLYFHHFLNHTARVLTPHDCPDNPLRTILPRMAMHNPDLLNLLFAYSASHRARLLSHPEPKSRIAYWVRDVFPNLRHALSFGEPVSDATLATAIMLASREIITPNTFEVDIPWQDHLGIARQMIIQRGGLKDMGENGSPVVNFLARWFAYLDVIGSLGGYKNEAPLAEEYWSFPQDTLSQRSKSSVDEDDHGFAIDCFFGFTNCCIVLLARVARLAHECDKERIDSRGQVDPDWAPPTETRAAAERLVTDLSERRDHVYAGCRHRKRTDQRDWDTMSESARMDLQEIVSVNEAFHLAGLIHLYRRVLGRPSADQEVQKCVGQVLEVLKQVRKGGTAESCLLFPMFTAGCDAIDEGHREVILERMKLVEGLGMTHVQKARTLMQTSWTTGKAWETLASGEFFG